ncbi:hypothetical protein [[Eubacterium] cellulosolvens]
MFFEYSNNHILSNSEDKGVKERRDSRLDDRFEKCDGFSDIFELVKKVVKESLNQYRVGLMLVLADLPINVGAFHTLGSNTIIMNRILLRLFERYKSNYKKEFIFLILLHEYLHTLGYTHEADVRILSYKIVTEAFGMEHPLSRIAENGPFSLIQEMSQRNIFDSKDDPELVRDLENVKHPYIQ